MARRARSSATSGPRAPGASLPTLGGSVGHPPCSSSALRLSMAPAMRSTVPSSRVGRGDCETREAGACAGARVAAGFRAGVGPTCASAGAATANAIAAIMIGLCMVALLRPPPKPTGMAVFGRPRSRRVLRRSAPGTTSAGMKDARGLDVTTDDPGAVAAADDFAARALRLDQGAEAILDAAERWPEAAIIALYAAAFWLYGQTESALANAATQLSAIEALTMNARERALYRALMLWQANDNLRAVEAMEAITAEWPGDLLTAKLAEFLYYVLGQQHMGPRFSAHMHRLEPMHSGDPDFLAM